MRRMEMHQTGVMDNDYTAADEVNHLQIPWTVDVAADMSFDYN